VYLWKRENGFTYQQRIPAIVESQFGKSPIRVNLGPLPVSEARKRAIILSGAAMQLMDDPTMTRETLVHSLRALNEEIKAIKSARFAKGVAAYGAQFSRDEFLEMGAEELAAEQAHKLAVINAGRSVFASFHNRLETIANALSKDSIAWDAERSTYQSVVQLLGSLERQAPPTEVQRQAVSPPSTTVGTRDPRAVFATTKLSVAGCTVLDARKAALDCGDKDRSRYEERLEATFSAFLEIVGDHPINYYLPIHLQDFATILGRVPTNRSKYPVFAGLTLSQIADKNDELPASERIKRLSESTIKSHLSEIKMIWSQATASVKDAAKFNDFNVTMPVAASASIDREGLPTPSINRWLADAVRPAVMAKPHKAWLPLVGFLTGMRLSELVYLQSKDLVNIRGNEVIDLRLPLLIRGKEVPRPLKTKTSVRIVAIHPLLRECGFIDFLKGQRGRDGFVFPHFHTAKDPADAAQKQMGNWMINLNIHATQQQVFHSLRHNAKAWFRIHAGDTLADRQCGHAAKSIGAAYGFKSLEPEEVEKIMAIPAPRDVDFTPFMNWYASRQ
jgi:integrase